MNSIVTSDDFIDTDLIIGPVYEDEIEPALRFGDYFGVPVVSPLAPTRKLDSDMLFQMTPDPATKYDKLLPLFEENANVIIVSSGAADDAEFEREIAAVLHGRHYGRLTVGQGDVASLIDWERPNVLVVLAGNEQSVNMALSTISSSYSNASARRSRRADISVIGTSKWAGYGSFVSKNLFFTLGVKFVTNYYIDRTNIKTRLFEARYIETYADFPSRAAFRGYDAIMLFGGALFEGRKRELVIGRDSFDEGGGVRGGRDPFGVGGESFADRFENVDVAPLGTPYRFVQAMGSARHVNDQWTLVSFTNDYNITTQ
jgi:hypothetical protein